MWNLLSLSISTDFESSLLKILAPPFEDKGYHLNEITNIYARTL